LTAAHPPAKNRRHDPVRLLQDVGLTIESDALRLRIVEPGRRNVEGCRGRLPPDDLARLEQRLAALEGLCLCSNTSTTQNS